MKALSSAALVLALAGMGCTTQTIPGPLVVSTRQLPELGTSGAGKLVTGESCSRTVLLFIPIGFATAESAYEDAVSQVPGADTLVAYEERATGLSIFPFYYEVCTEIHGYAVSAKPNSSESEPAPKSSPPESEPAP
jgi:hypothetical protein